MRRLASSLALALMLLLPAVAAAQFSGVRGSSLAAPPNVPFGCESIVDQDFASGGYFIRPAGQPSCTWWSTGTLGGAVTSPATSAVPTSGIVTGVRVRSGPNPAPLRVAIIRSVQSLASAGSGGSCCSGALESQTFQPTPNAVSGIALNLPVEVIRDTSSLSVQDYVAISGVGPGTLPIRDQGAHSLTQSGLAVSVMTAPKMEPDTTPRINNRAAPGWELLMQYDFVMCPNGNAPNGQCLGPQGTGQQQQPQPQQQQPQPNQAQQAQPVRPVARLAPPAGPALRVRGGRVPLRVACQAGPDCAGTLRLFGLRGETRRTLARQDVVVRGGRSRTLRLAPSKASRAWLRRRPTTKAQAVLTFTDGTKVTKALTIRR